MEKGGGRLLYTKEYIRKESFIYDYLPNKDNFGTNSINNL
jgi:hypothetical protein